MTREEAKTYFTKLAQDAGLEDAQKDAVLKAFDNDKFVAGATDPLMRHDDYSRKMDELAGEKKTWAEWYGKADQAYKTNLAGIETLKRYEQLYGPLEGQQAANNGANVLTRQEVEQLFAVRDQAYTNLLHNGLRIAQDHLHRFGAPLDTRELEKFALDRKITDMDRAYELYVTPKLDSQRQKQEADREAAMNERIKREREEAVRDYASRNKLPIETGPKPFHTFYDREAPKEGGSELEQERFARAGFLEGWDNWKPGTGPEPST